MTVRNNGRLGRSLLAVAAMLAMLPLANSQMPDVARLAVPGGPLTMAAPTANATAPVELYVRLTDLPLAAVAGNKRTGMKMTGDQQRAYAAQLRQKQAALMSQISSMGGAQLAGLTNATNALVVEISANQAAAIAQLPGVAQVLPVGQYELDLSATVPYIGATALQGLGVNGTGVTVAVLDSGVDFMHYDLGGTGVLADYATCYAQNAVAPSGLCASYFGPSAPKVIGGYDFVGENWPNTVLEPDPNPIARAVTGGHGTNVSDIILGRLGVAPGAKTYAYKVCSAVSSSCSGVAILQGFDRALDPNADGDLSDAVDVINLSLGASYGQRENSSVQAANNASLVGSVVVVSAGNSANRPFITGSPSTATSAISVAQTQVPSAVVPPLIINSPGSVARTITNTATVPWAPIGAGFANKDLLNTVTLPGQTLASDMCNIGLVPAGALAGKVALTRRGTCGISLKVQNATSLGAVGFVLDNNVPGDPPSFSQGPEMGPFAPTVVISLADGNLLRGAVGTVNASTGTPVNAVGSLVTTSSRGPNMQLGMIKPDIGAPGASLSALVGTGTGRSVFGGTSGAAPMVAGAAALLLQSNPGLLPHEVKARLMNAAETQITTYAGPASPTNPLAPITRIGGGEVRVDKSHALKTAAWDASDPSAVSLSMGVVRQNGSLVYRKRVLVRNYDSVARTYTIARGFRYANDAASNAVTLSSPNSITVPANGNATFILSAVVNANNLPNWAATGINGGFNGGDGSLLDLPEYDGYITISQGADTVRLPWHILPHQAHNVVAPANVAMGGNPTAPLNLSNAGGSVAGSVDVFYLTGTSPVSATPIPVEGQGIALIDLRAVGVRAATLGGTSAVQFAVNTYGARSHPNYPARISVFLDVNNDGVDDFEVWTQESGAFASTGQNVTFVRKMTSGTGSGFFFTDADLASGNAILTIPMAATLAGTGANLALTTASTFRYRVVVSDNYFTGLITDSIPQMTVRLDNPRFGVTSFAPGPVPIGGSAGLTVVRNAAGDAAFPSQQGLLMMYRDGKFGREADIVNIAP